MNELGIDIETYSGASLKLGGMHRYVEDPDFEILLISYSINQGPVNTIRLAETKAVPESFLDMLLSPDYLKTAWNAQFEMTCFEKAFGITLDYSQWECTMCKASMLSYPMSLDTAGKVMGLDVQKDKRGKALIKMFSEPQKISKKNSKVRYYWYDSALAWDEFIRYNVKDVIVEQEVRQKISFLKWHPRERHIWVLDQIINKRGIMLDEVFFNQAIRINYESSKKLMAEAIDLTGLDNPNSIKQLKDWLDSAADDDVGKMTKENIKKLIKKENDPNIKRVLEIRQSLAKTSVKKYQAMNNCMMSDKRARGLFQYNGASKTGRWGSRLIQLHNLAKNKIKKEDLALARKLVYEGNLEDIELMYGSVQIMLSELIRPAIIAPPGTTFLISDFAGIEARMLSYLANEQWRIEVYKTDRDMYSEAGARMFKTTYEAVKADKEGLRFKSKTAELALGYQGSVGALDKMDEQGLSTGLNQQEKKELVYAWRGVNKKIVQYWYDVDAAAIAAVSEPGRLVQLRHCKFVVKNQILFIQLPSGRLLSYIKPFLKKNKFDNDAVHYYGIDQKTAQWKVQDTYGGKLVENIVQGASRDVLADAMLRLHDAGFYIVLHVHDETVSEVKIGEEAEMLKKAGEIMGTELPWAPGLPLKVESFISPFYIKEQ